ncbi:potassium channel family protein [Chloroflexota bacterium]
MVEGEIMYIIVIGGGRVGYHLTKTLIEQGHEAIIVEKNPYYCDVLSGELGSLCVHGDGCEVSTLTEVGTNRADMLVAVTGDDEDNLVSCQVAKHKFNVPHTIARIRNPKNEAIFKKLGVDVTVSSTNIILEAIQQELPTHAMTHLLYIRHKGLEVVEIKIAADSPTIGKTIRELSLPPRSKLSLLIRKGVKPLIPTNNTILQAEDQLIAITAAESEEQLRAALRGS